MSLYKRGGVWWYDFQLRGVRIRESTGLTSRVAAQGAEALRKAELIKNPAARHANDRSPWFDEFALKEFADWSENQHREHPSTHARYMRSVKVLLRFLGHRSLDMISTADVEQFKIARRREPRRYARDGRTVTPAAVNRDLALLRILFNLAIRLKKVKTNPVCGVKLLPENSTRTRVLSWEEEEAYLLAASPTLRDVASLILETGMRPGEAFRLRKDDINLQDVYVRIQSGKTRSARRTIPLTKRAFDVLARRIAGVQSEWLFPSTRDFRHALESVKDAHVRALALSGIQPPFRLYDLRHTALTRMAMAGIDLPTLRELAGHASIQMTVRYVHPTPEHKKSALRRLEDFRAEAARQEKAEVSGFPKTNLTLGAKVRSYVSPGWHCGPTVE